MKATRREVLLGAAATGLFGLRGVRAQAQAPTIRIGVLADLSGSYRDTSGETAVNCARQAVKDSGVLERGLNVEIIAADHQQKTDVGVNIIRQWIDRDGVDAVAEVNHSAIALGASDFIRSKDKVFLASGPATADLTGKACSPNTVHWALDTWCRAKSTGGAIVKKGGKTWYFITANYTFGQSLQDLTSAVVEQQGGKVVGKSVYPFPETMDFSSFLLSAASAKPNVVAFANAAADLANCVKQMREFNMDKTVIPAALGGFITDVHSMGLGVAQGMLVTETFYWDLNPRTRAFTQRLLPSSPRNYPNSEHAATYASVLHYLKTAAAMGPAEAKASGRQAVAAMKRLPTDDDCFGAGTVREDGRVIIPTYLFQAKAPSESTSGWDVYRLVATTPADQAFRPLDQAVCATEKFSL